MVIPAIDVLGTEAVRLHKGSYGDVVDSGHDPVELARRFGAAGVDWVHVVDLDGARSGVLRPALVRELAAAASPSRLQASGGVRSVADAQTLLAAGASRVVVGTAAFAGDLDTFVATLGESLVVALDVRDGAVVTRGWTESAGSLDAAIERCSSAGVRRVLCTAVERDGTGAGPDVELVRRVAGAGIPVLAAGGVRHARDVDELLAAGAEAVIAGRAVLSGALAL